jgi:hypothetical protein
VERLTAREIERHGVLNPEPDPDSRGDLNADKWEQFRNVPMRFRIDEDGRRRRRMTKMALATVIVALVFAIIFWARHQWREASLYKPTVLSGPTYLTYPSERLALSKSWTKLWRSLAAVVPGDFPVIPAVPAQIMSLFAALRTCLSSQNTDGVTLRARPALGRGWSEPRNLTLDLFQLGCYFMLKIS